MTPLLSLYLACADSMGKATRQIEVFLSTKDPYLTIVTLSGQCLDTNYGFFCLKALALGSMLMHSLIDRVFFVLALISFKELHSL
jgi:hypothetical protein